MYPDVSKIGQIALAVRDVDRAEAFYENVLGLRKLYRFGDLTFFDCAGVRLLLEKAHDPSGRVEGSVIYFRGADIALARAELARRGAVFSDASHLIAPMDDHDLWMTFLTDPDGHTLALDAGGTEGLRAVGRRRVNRETGSHEVGRTLAAQPNDDEALAEGVVGRFVGDCGRPAPGRALARGEPAGGSHRPVAPARAAADIRPWISRDYHN